MRIRKDVLLALALGGLWILGDMSKRKRPEKKKTETPPYNGVNIPVRKYERRARPCV